MARKRCGCWLGTSKVNVVSPVEDEVMVPELLNWSRGYRLLRWGSPSRLASKGGYSEPVLQFRDKCLVRSVVREQATRMECRERSRTTERAKRRFWTESLSENALKNALHAQFFVVCRKHLNRH